MQEPTPLARLIDALPCEYFAPIEQYLIDAWLAEKRGDKAALLHHLKQAIENCDHPPTIQVLTCLEGKLDV